MGIDTKGKALSFSKYLTNGFLFFYLNRTERNSYTTHSEIVLEAIKDGKSRSTEGFFSSGFGKMLCGERTCETSFSECL